MFDNFLLKLSSTARGLIIIDHADGYLDIVRAHCNSRTAGRKWREVKRVVEIGYSAASHANPMIQLTDLVTFTMRRHAEMAGGYREDWPKEAKDFSTACHGMLWPRVQYKELSLPKVSPPAELIDYVKSVRCY